MYVLQIKADMVNDQSIRIAKKQHQSFKELIDQPKFL